MFYVINGFKISRDGKSLKVGIFDREVVLKHGGVVKKYTLLRTERYKHCLECFKKPKKDTRFLVPYYNAYKFLKTLFQLY